jgi:glycosyltransferase involved in cell wall biosynthesis
VALPTGGPRRNIVFVGDRCCDHSPSSGYDQICSLFPDAGWLSQRELSAGRLTWYREPADPPGPHSLFHVFYGDRSPAPSLLRSRFPGALILATLHQPVAPLSADQAWRESIGWVDAIVTLCENQTRQLAESGFDRPVHRVPHGVRTSAFAPLAGPTPAPRNRALLVGNHLRDWPTAGEVVSRLAGLGVESLVVEPRGSYLRTPGGYFESMYPRVPEPELARLYDTSAAMFLPVEDATASNALMEAMAAGCPVVSTNVQALVEYLGDSSDAFEPRDAGTAVAKLLAYVRDPERRFERSKQLMERARRFDWSQLRPALTEVYRAVADGQSRPLDSQAQRRPA